MEHLYELDVRGVLNGAVDLRKGRNEKVVEEE